MRQVLAATFTVPLSPAPAAWTAFLRPRRLAEHVPLGCWSVRGRSAPTSRRRRPRSGPPSPPHTSTTR